MVVPRKGCRAIRAEALMTNKVVSKNICVHKKRRFCEILLAKRETRGCKMLLANSNEMGTAIVKVPLPRGEKWLWWKTEHPMKTSVRTPECVSCLQRQTLFCEYIHHIKFTDSRMNLGHWFWNPKNFLCQDLCIDIKRSTNFVAEIFFLLYDVIFAILATPCP